MLHKIANMNLSVADDDTKVFRPVNRWKLVDNYDIQSGFVTAHHRMAAALNPKRTEEDMISFHHDACKMVLFWISGPNSTRNRVQHCIDTLHSWIFFNWICRGACQTIEAWKKWWARNAEQHCSNICSIAMGAHPDVQCAEIPDIAQASVPNQIAMKEGYSWMHLLIEFYHAAFRQHGLQMLHHFLLQTLLTKINNALWILNFTVTFRGKGINFRRVNEVSGDVSCSLWWTLGIRSFSVDRFNQLTTGGGWDKPVLVDIMSAGKLLGIASAATPNSTKNHCCIHCHWQFLQRHPGLLLFSCILAITKSFLEQLIC